MAGFFWLLFGIGLGYFTHWLQTLGERSRFDEFKKTAKKQQVRSQANLDIYERKDALYLKMVAEVDRILDKAAQIESQNDELSAELRQLRKSFNLNVSQLSK